MLRGGDFKELEFFGERVRCFLFNKNIHDEFNLPNFYNNRETKNFSEIMWYNADYRFYYVKKFFPEYKYYWQFDYDVFMNGESYSAFFEKYKGDEDLIICNYRSMSDKNKWYWSQGVDWAYSEVEMKSSLYPICRLNSCAIDYLYKRRLEYGRVFKDLTGKKDVKWLNCELFTPTELYNGGFKCGKIDEPNVRFKPEIDLNEDRVFENPDNLLYHPVKGDFVKRIETLENRPSHFAINFLGIKMKFKANAKRH